MELEKPKYLVVNGEPYTINALSGIRKIQLLWITSNCNLKNHSINLKIEKDREKIPEMDLRSFMNGEHHNGMKVELKNQKLIYGDFLNLSISLVSGNKELSGLTLPFHFLVL